MKFQNIKALAPAAALLLCLGFSSCVNDLDVTPIDPNTITTADVNGIFNKCYANMAVAGNGGANGDCDIDGLDGGTTGFVRQLFNANELTTDESICSWGDEGIPAFNYNQYNASHPMLKGWYYRLYFGVTMCNSYLAEFSDYNATMTAEVRFLRAMYYFQLLDCFGNVPFVTRISSELSQQIARADLYKWVEEELLAAESGMSEDKAKKSTDKGYGRADKAAAWLLLSRLYLNAEVYTNGKVKAYDKAAVYAKKVMDSDYKLCTTKATDKNGYTWSAYQKLFMGDNGETDAAYEGILPVICDGVSTTSWGTSLFLIAGTFNSDMSRYNGKTNGTSEGWGGYRARKQLIDKFFPNGDCPEGAETDEILAAAGDDRACFWSAGHTLHVEDANTFTSGYAVTKFLNFYSTGADAKNAQFPDADYFLMRKAEAYLTYAEALTRQAGTTNAPKEAVDAINVLRTRAGASTCVNISLNEICDEWSREFYYEGRRRSDLVRFGFYGGHSDYKWDWKGGAENGTNFSADLNIFAIPSTDLDANSNLVQNPGY